MLPAQHPICRVGVSKKKRLRICPGKLFFCLFFGNLPVNNVTKGIARTVNSFVVGVWLMLLLIACA